MSDFNLKRLNVCSSGPGKGDNMDRLHLEGDKHNAPHEYILINHWGWSDGAPYDETNIGFESDGEGGLVMFRTDPERVEEDPDRNGGEVKVMHIPATWLTQDPNWLKEYDLEKGRQYYEMWRGSAY